MSKGGQDAHSHPPTLICTWRQGGTAHAAPPPRGTGFWGPRTSGGGRGRSARARPGHRDGRVPAGSQQGSALLPRGPPGAPRAPESPPPAHPARSTAFPARCGLGAGPRRGSPAPSRAGAAGCQPGSCRGGGVDLLPVEGPARGLRVSERPGAEGPVPATEPRRIRPLPKALIKPRAREAPGPRNYPGVEGRELFPPPPLRSRRALPGPGGPGAGRAGSGARGWRSRVGVLRCRGRAGTRWAGAGGR